MTVIFFINYIHCTVNAERRWLKQGGPFSCFDCIVITKIRSHNQRKMGKFSLGAQVINYFVFVIYFINHPV